MIFDFKKIFRESEINEIFRNCSICGMEPLHDRSKDMLDNKSYYYFKCTNCNIHFSLFSVNKILGSTPKNDYYLEYLLDYILIRRDGFELIFDQEILKVNKKHLPDISLDQYFMPTYLLESAFRNINDLNNWVNKILILA